NNEKLPDGQIAGLAVDGQVYVFYQDGRAFKFNNGRRQAINIKPVEPQSKGWLNCQLLADSEDFYCLESGSERILHYSKDGANLAQYKVTSTIMAAAINKASKAIYLLDSQAVEKFELPGNKK
ncbi:MAG TPA: hypothetical protein PKN62_02185, partial [bacterium]|nr:hypothetical protein [bacterium]